MPIIVKQFSKSFHTTTVSSSKYVLFRWAPCDLQNICTPFNEPTVENGNCTKHNCVCSILKYTQELQQQPKKKKNWKIAQNSIIVPNIKTCTKSKLLKLTVSQSPFLRVKIGTPPVAVKHIKCNDILHNHRIFVLLQNIFVSFSCNFCCTCQCTEIYNWSAHLPWHLLRNLFISTIWLLLLS